MLELWDCQEHTSSQVTMDEALELFDDLGLVAFPSLDCVLLGSQGQVLATRWFWATGAYPRVVTHVLTDWGTDTESIKAALPNWCRAEQKE